MNIYSLVRIVYIVKNVNQLYKIAEIQEQIKHHKIKNKFIWTEKHKKKRFEPLFILNYFKSNKN